MSVVGKQTDLSGSSQEWNRKNAATIYFSESKIIEPGFQQLGRSQDFAQPKDAQRPGTSKPRKYRLCPQGLLNSLVSLRNKRQGSQFPSSASATSCAYEASHELQLVSRMLGPC